MGGVFNVGWSFDARDCLPRLQAKEEMMLTSDQIRKVVGKAASQRIIDGVLSSMEKHAEEFGLKTPDRATHFLAQIAHESAHFKRTREYASGAAYEGRKDLGNTRKGDGKRFKGRGLIQLTGRANYRTFTRWMRKRLPDCPDFEANPELVALFPWAFWATVYYWSSRGLNRYADSNNIETITRRINGGLTGYADRLRYYDGFALAYLDYPIGASGIRQFQKDKGLEPDAISGPVTRRAMRSALKALKSAPANVPKPKPKPKPPIVEVMPPPPPKPEQSIWTKAAALIGRFFLIWRNK